MQGNGFNYRSTQQFESCRLNAVKESRSERVGLYRNEQGGLLAWYINKEGTAPQTGTLEHSPEQDISRKNGVDNQYRTYATI